MQKFLEEELADIIKRLIMPRLSKNGDGCWRWKGWRDRVGYGRVTVRRLGDKKNYYVHRLMYAYYKGNIPKKKEIHHKCYTRECCNPDHLELTNHSANIEDRFLKAGKEIEVDRF
ncbi:MAG: hypothetical protein GTO45_26365 [Candidatus Aminicenantes bacterium]|nr:hypothetical protein [Candidatus Aminicenantes bacterium]NIN21668.1 hypothetical protein [Candidatus Aminicenantes bacterium]NIN45463.1 hypothetical protein [Candidatus Aminicenantes bacterium]NIN88294.1 hypothetical protein [Candidatus Aminicenantes bacterium]NIO84687.1 hypothetical protein [Candidatus Aminicenantes bacterium]